MKKIIFSILFFTGCILFLSCKKVPVEGVPLLAANRIPIANAGADQTITLPKDSVSLDGSASSDPDGNIISYQWSKISGPASANIINASASKTVVKNLAAGVYQFQLTVIDNGGLSANATVKVIVNNPAVNQPPVANAGVDQIITLPFNSAILNGSASTDPDNNITGYNWTKISGPSSFNIANANAVQTQVTNLVQGIYQFELKVTDAGGLFSKDTVLIIVNPIPSGNSSVWFWTRDLVYNPIYININNETKILDESWGGVGDPSCYPYGGSMDFNLPAGQYTYKTWRQGRDTIRRTVTVMANACNSIEIKY
ncbi:MAG: PKD domain-containing protein [Bacteroidota bacterium]|nr:PKD domain-containing protein [Bacteroidota bacterium]